MSDKGHSKGGGDIKEFQEKVDRYMESHGKSSIHYQQAIDYGLSKHVTKPGERKTLGDLLKPGSPLEDKLKEAFDQQLAYMGIGNLDEYGKEVLMRDLGVTIEDLRTQNKGRLSQTYSSRFIVEVMDQVKTILGNKLSNAIISELGKYEGTDHYATGIDYVVNRADLEQSLPTLSADVKSHAEVQQYLSRPLSRVIAGKAETEYEAKQYKGKSDGGHGGGHH